MNNSISIKNTKYEYSSSSIAMSLYFFALFFLALLGNIYSAALNTFVLWAVGPIVTIYILIKNAKSVNDIPSEYKLYLSLVIFGLLGYFQITNYSGYFRYLQSLITNGVLMVLIYISVKNIKDWYLLLISLLVTILVTVFYSMYIETGMESDYFYRLTGLPGNANGMASFSRIAILLILFFLFQKIKKIYSIILVSLIPFLFYSIILTASRQTFINIIFVFLMFVVIKFFYGRRSILFGLILFIVGNAVLSLAEGALEGYLLYDRLLGAATIKDVSDEARVQLYKITWKLFVDHPILGMGLYEYINYTGGSMSHTDLLDLAVQLGIFAALLYIMIYVKAFTKLFEYVLQNDRLKINNKSTHWLIIILVSEIIYGLSNPNWFTQLQMVVLSLIITYIYKIYQKPKYSLSRTNFN